MTITALRHFLRDDDLSPLELTAVLDRADVYKADRNGFRPLAGRANRSAHISKSLIISTFSQCRNPRPG